MMFDLFTPHAILFKHFTITEFWNIMEMLSGIMNEPANAGVPVAEMNAGTPAEQCFVKES